MDKRAPFILRQWILDYERFVDFDTFVIINAMAWISLQLHVFDFYVILGMSCVYYSSMTLYETHK